MANDLADADPGAVAEALAALVAWRRAWLVWQEADEAEAELLRAAAWNADDELADATDKLLSKIEPTGQVAARQPPKRDYKARAPAIAEQLALDVPAEASAPKPTRKRKAKKGNEDDKG